MIKLPSDLTFSGMFLLKVGLVKFGACRGKLTIVVLAFIKVNPIVLRLRLPRQAPNGQDN